MTPQDSARHDSTHTHGDSDGDRAVHRETRVTSPTGGMKGTKPERYDLLPRTALDAVAVVYGHGAAKYADHNWRKGYAWSLSYAALMRHLTAFWDGENYDTESGLPHLSHAAFHVNTLLVRLLEDGAGSVYDDRWDG